MQWELCPGSQCIMIPGSPPAPDSTVSVREYLGLLGLMDTSQHDFFLKQLKKRKISLEIIDSYNFISSSLTTNQFKSGKVNPKEVGLIALG